MKEEISKIIAMVQEGKIEPEKATELIHLLKDKDSVSASSKNEEYLDKMLRVRISSEDGDKVNVNLPLRLVKVGLKAGLSIAAKIPESAKYVEDIDIIDVELVLEAIENELSGQIVDITSANGEKVSVVIE